VAVAEMKKLNLVAMSYEKDGILNALQRTGATEIKTHYEVENTSVVSEDCNGLRDELNSLESALSLLCAEVDAYNKDNKIKTEELKDGFSVSYTEFMCASALKSDCAQLVGKINGLYDERRELSVSRAKLLKTAETAEIYSVVKEKLSVYKSSGRVKIKLGTVPVAGTDALFAAVKVNELCAVEVLKSDSETALILFAAHKAAEGADEILQSAGFSACPFPADKSGEEVYAQTVEEIKNADARLAEISEGIYALGKNVKTLKVYSDYLSFKLEKITASEKMRKTARTFLLEAYLPKEAENTVKEALDETSNAVYYEFNEPAEDEIPPTLLKNNAAVKNFEAITNMYSPVSYREFDPNTVMALFYSVFVGFIMADVGYGLLMFVIGGFIYLRSKRDTGLKRLSGVFAIGGIFAVVWGLLFNSFFGMQPPFMPTLLPDPQKEMWTVMGIKIPAVLIISLLLGMVQLCAGYLCKAVQCWRRNHIADGIFDGLVWAVFTVGVALAVVALVDQFKAPKLITYIGGITAGASLLCAMLTAGRKEKLLGKFTKGFGAAYGVINVVSDILSYARLYGLMLSGAVIAQIVSRYAVDFITGGNAILIILGAVLMIVGHGFNLAIGLLGAYIHDARLQYVEFYGRFFEGEGELFSPLGSDFKYVNLNIK